jgi:4-hydroxy-tetrahydrodipicolinate reductase
MNIALIGYGKMGQAITKLCKEKHNIKLIVDPNNSNLSTSADTQYFETIEAANFENIDVAIDFTHPSVIMNNIQTYCEKGVNVVVGTTGWTDQINNVQAMVEKANIGFLWASNFSIGVHLFWQMVERGAQLMNKFDDYDAFGHEYHHNQKADSPSGTARSTAEILINKLDRKTTLVTEELNRTIKPQELHFSSTRGGNIPGTHSVFFDSLNDTIEIKHTARNRSGFASGSIQCAEWLKGKTGFFTIENYLKDLTQ